jgi:hypothetical protein
MKNTLKKVIAFLLVFSFVFAFAACNDDDDKETTTAAATTVEGDTTAEATTVDGETTTVDGETTTEGITDPNATTTAGVTDPNVTTTAATAIKAPIGGTKTQVIEFYNQYGNAMKSYKGKVTVTKKDGTVSEITKLATDGLPFGLGDRIRDKALELLPNDYETKPTYTFVNGTSTKDNKNLAKWLPRDASTKLSELSPTGANGVKSATCVASGSGWKITILMNDDITSGATALSDKPKYVSKCMDTLSLTAADLDPFTLLDATVNYSGCSINAVFDAQGRMTKLDILTPAKIAGNLKGFGVTLKDTQVVGNYKGNYTFAY